MFSEKKLGELSLKLKDIMREKQGEEFAIALFEFMETQKFKNKVVRKLFEDDKLIILFFSDSINNPYGIVLIEEIGVCAALQVAPLEFMYNRIEEYKANKRDSIR